MRLAAGVRALAVHADVIVVVSSVWQTTATFVRAGGEGFLIDSPILPDELDALSQLAEQTGFPVSGLLATHADWDHLLGRLAFPELSLGVAESTAERLQASPGEAHRAMRAFDAQWYIERPKPLQLAGVQELPVPGRLDLGSGETAVEIELHPTPGHTADGVAYWLPWAKILVVGDYLSPVENPDIADREAYVATLQRLAPLVEEAEIVVPGHGAPMASTEAARILAKDVAHASSAGEDPGQPKP